MSGLPPELPLELLARASAPPEWHLALLPELPLAWAWLPASSFAPRLNCWNSRRWSSVSEPVP